MQRADDPVLALHVVRGGEHMAEGRPADDPPAAAVGDGVGEVRTAALDPPGLERPPHQSRQRAVEMDPQLLGVEARGVD
ncbi:hypothetical protein [Streptomyces sp. I6]|uniref:hypothetical protein n=1 Tax=Streptomyces sp. I6 TaxID=2483113 RepID=UPI0037DA3585